MPIIDYHYIKQGRVDFKIPSCALSDFKTQLDFLQNNFKITSLVEFANKKSAKNLIALTFDDGTAGQYRYAFPEIIKRGLPASFFPIASVFEGVVPSTIKLHIVLSKTKVSIFKNRLQKYLVTNYRSQYSNFIIPDDRRLDSLKRLKDDIITVPYLKPNSLSTRNVS